MRWASAALLLAVVVFADDSPPVPKHRVWYLIWKASATQAIEAGTKGVTLTNRITGEQAKLPRRPGLDAAKTRAIVMAEVRRLFKGLNLEFHWGAEKVPEGASAIEIGAESLDPLHAMMPTLMGVSEIDHYDQLPNVLRVINGRGVFINGCWRSMQVYAARTPKSTRSALFTQEYFSKFVGMVVAHEIGHALGLYHIQPAPQVARWVMATNQRAVAGVPFTWSPVARGYLQWLLRPGADPKVGAEKMVSGDEVKCPLCWGEPPKEK